MRKRCLQLATPSTFTVSVGFCHSRKVMNDCGTSRDDGDAAAVNSTAAQIARTYPVSLSVKYWISGDPQHGCPAESKVWDERNPKSFDNPPSSGLSSVKPSPGDFSFSGMHDHGMLPIPKAGGPMSSLISFVAEARKANDKYLTQVIEEEKSHREREEKRAKISDD